MRQDSRPEVVASTYIKNHLNILRPPTSVERYGSSDIGVQLLGGIKPNLNHLLCPCLCSNFGSCPRQSRRSARGAHYMCDLDIYDILAAMPETKSKSKSIRQRSKGLFLWRVSLYIPREVRQNKTARKAHQQNNTQNGWSAFQQRRLPHKRIEIGTCPDVPVFLWGNPAH